MKPGDIVMLDRAWGGYGAEAMFKVVEIIPCGEVVDSMTGQKSTPVNLRVVFADEAVPSDTRMCRTIPAEYACPVPKRGSTTTVYANQGDRDATVLGNRGRRVLLEYEMPAGRTFLRIIDLLNPGWYSPISVTNARKYWKEEME